MSSRVLQALSGTLFLTTISNVKSVAALPLDELAKPILHVSNKSRGSGPHDYISDNEIKSINLQRKPADLASPSRWVRNMEETDKTSKPWFPESDSKQEPTWLFRNDTLWTL